LDFSEDIENVLGNICKNVNRLDDKNVLNQMFNDIHSLKGFARVLELNTLAEKLHIFENIFSKLRNQEILADKKLENDIIQFTNDLYEEQKNIKKLLDMILSFTRFLEKTTDSKSKALMNNFIISLNDMVNSISKELDKEIEFKPYAAVEDFPHLNKMRNAIIHLIRNAIDHGIEDKFERLSNFKEQKGTIILKLHKDDAHFFVEVADDGGGLNFDMIKKKALEKNKIKDDLPLSEMELMNIIFSPDFSTKNKVSTTSGRGVGLNVVKRDVEKLKGKIEVATKKGKGTKFILKIPNDIIKNAEIEKKA